MTKEIQKSENTAMTVKSLLEKNKASLASILPKHVNIDRLSRNAFLAIQTNPQLMKCTPSSLFYGITRACSIGLSVGSQMGEAALVPFWNSKKGAFEAQFMPMYQGLVKLARQSGEVAVIHSQEIRENDEFIQEHGTPPRMIHNIKYVDRKRRGEIIGYQASYTLKSGESDFVVLDLEDIAKARSIAKAKTVWDENPVAMGKKTAIKRLAKTMPMSDEMTMAVQYDNIASTDDSSASSEFVDIEGFEVLNTDLIDKPKSEKAKEATKIKEEELKKPVGERWETK